MPIVVGVACKPLGKIIQYASGSLELKKTDAVIVEAASANGSAHAEFGIVQTPPRALPDAEVPRPLRPVLRLATLDDFGQRERVQQRQAEAYRVCQEKIARLHVPMKLVEAEAAFDGSQVTFHFVSDGRVDFRELVREVAGVLHTRVQMHQVGPRDEARIYPGIGPCGRPTCCSTFLREFEPVSIKMLKDQNLAQNPAKVTGLCGKLMCCLRYERDTPDAPGTPQENQVVMTPMGRAKVVEVNTVQQMATVLLETQAFVEVRFKDIGEVDGCVDHTEGDCAGCASTGALAACAVPTRDRPAGVAFLPMAQ